MKNAKMISVTAPAFNEAESLPRLYEEVSAQLKKLNYDYEIVVVENGSTDGSLEVLRGLNQKDPHLKYISLSRNFGAQGGTIAGLHHCRGDAVISMDADLQHPASVIPLLVAEWEKGFKIVNSERTSLKIGFFRRVFNKIFYSLMNRLTGMRLGHSDFRLLDRMVVNELVGLSETEKFLRGLVCWVGFSKTTVSYSAAERLYGKTKFRFWHLVDFALHGITSFSTEPLRIVTKLGLIVFVPSFLYMIYVLIFGIVSALKSDYRYLPPGWLTLVVTIYFFGSVQLLSVGILGEYIGRIFNETKRRPGFIVQEKSP